MIADGALAESDTLEATVPGFRRIGSCSLVAANPLEG
jgi:hypothetical protein